MNKVDHHVGYEFTMMQEVNLIWEGKPVQYGSYTLNNMCNMVAFSTAWKLITFLEHEKKVKIPVGISRLLDKIYDQIIVLEPSRREEKLKKKLQVTDFVKLKKFIEKHIKVVLS